MKGTLITVTKDEATGLDYAIYLIKDKNGLWIATFDVGHGMIVQVQALTLSEERIPEPVGKAVREWLL